MALKVMVEEEEKSRPRTEAGDTGLIGIPEETSVACNKAEDWYVGTVGGGAEQETLPICGNRTTNDKTETPNADSESRDRWFQARQLETLDIGEANPGGVCVIGKKIATDHEEPVAMDKSVNRKGDSTRLPTLAPETMAVGPERPRESLEEEGGGVNSRISLMSMRGMDEEKPSKPVPATSVFGPMRSQGSEGTDDGVEESWHDAREGCEMACETVDEGTRERPDRGPCRAVLQAVWDAIRPWFVRPRPESA